MISREDTRIHLWYDDHKSVNKKNGNINICDTFRITLFCLLSLLDTVIYGIQVAYSGVIATVTFVWILPVVLFFITWVVGLYTVKKVQLNTFLVLTFFKRT